MQLRLTRGFRFTPRFARRLAFGTAPFVTSFAEKRKCRANPASPDRGPS